MGTGTDYSKGSGTRGQVYVQNEKVSYDLSMLYPIRVWYWIHFLKRKPRERITHLTVFGRKSGLSPLRFHLSFLCKIST